MNLVNLISDYWDGEATFFDLPEVGHVISESVMPLVAITHDQRMFNIGTCFVISSFGVILSAEHCLKGTITRLERGGDRKILNAPDDQVLHLKDYALAVLWVRSTSNGGLEGMPWPVHGAHAARPLDVMAATLKSAIDQATKQPMRFRRLPISPAIPPAGSRVFVLGYHDMNNFGKFGLLAHSEDKPSNAPRQMHVQRKQRLSAAVGHVEKIYSERMDRGMCKFPCFTLDLDTELPHGFSGGPIINEDGSVCGVVSGGKVASLLYPALLTPVELANGSTKLLDLMRDGHIASDGSEKLVTFTAPAEINGRWSCSHPHEPHNQGFIFKDIDDENEQKE